MRCGPTALPTERIARGERYRLCLRSPMFDPLKRRVRQMIREALQPAMLPPKPAEPSAQPPVSFLRENSSAAYLRTDFDKQLKRAQAAWLKEMETFTNSFGCVQFQPMPMLAQRHLKNCRFLPDSRIRASPNEGRWDLCRGRSANRTIFQEMFLAIGRRQLRFLRLHHLPQQCKFRIDSCLRRER